MILPDTNIWIDHLRRPDPDLTALVLQKRVRLHPYVLGEIALGLQGPARSLLDLFGEMRSPRVAKPHELLAMIEARELQGSGIGYVDAHLLAATFLEVDGRLWTRDKRLARQAERFGVAYTP